MAGGAAVGLTDCALLGNCAGAVAVDPATISGLAGGRLLAAPKDGTVLRGLPSNTLWEIVGGIRRQTFVNVAGVSVDDGATRRHPAALGPAGPGRARPELRAGDLDRLHRLPQGTRLTSLKVRDAPVGSKVAVACNSRKRGCPYRGKSYAVASLRTRSVLGKLRNRRLKSRAVVTVKVTSPLGAVKVVTIKMRSKKLPVRSLPLREGGRQARQVLT